MPSTDIFCCYCKVSLLVTNVIEKTYDKNWNKILTLSWKQGDWGTWAVEEEISLTGSEINVEPGWTISVRGVDWFIEICSEQIKPQRSLYKGQKRIVGWTNDSPKYHCFK